MRTHVVSDKVKVVEYRTVKLKIGKFVVTESYTDGELTAQDLHITGGFKNTHRKAYQPKDLNFHYYEDISFLTSEALSNTDEYYDVIPKPTLVTDWDTFKGFNHVLCLWMGMDGNIYRIDRATPLSTWRRQDYIGGFPSRKYHHLPEFKEELEALALDCLRNIEIIDIPHYNGGGQAIEFDYKTPVSMISLSFQITNPHVAKIAKKFRRKEDDD